MKTKIYFLILYVILSISGYSQEWQETGGEVEGGGITDLMVQESTGNLFAVAGSYNWPNGENGGIRRSTDQGDTWENLFDAYTGRAIIEGPDGYLYASIWDYPSAEGLYRSTDNGTTWNLLISVPTGNNIFSICIVPGNPQTICAGTRQGVYRSLDNGVNWAYSNSGMPGNAWVRGMDVSDAGIIAAGTTQGLYVSSDNGDNWDKVLGDGQNDTIVAVTFAADYTGKDDDEHLFFGSTSGQLFLTTVVVAYTVATLIATLTPTGEIVRFRLKTAGNILVPFYLMSTYAALGGNFFLSMFNYSSWVLFNNGLPPSAMISIFTIQTLTLTSFIIYVGMYGNSPTGAKTYKREVDTSTGIPIPFADNFGYILDQNRPNPFKQYSEISFELPESGQTSLTLFDMTGKMIKTLVDKVLPNGRHSVNVTSEGLKSGIYYYQLQSNNVMVTKKLVVN